MPDKIFEQLKQILKTNIFKDQELSAYLVLGLAGRADYFFLANNENLENLAKDSAIRIGIPFCVIDHTNPIVFTTPIFRGLVIYRSYQAKNNLKYLKLFEDIYLNTENEKKFRQHFFKISKQSVLNNKIEAKDLLAEVNITKYSIGGIKLTTDNLNIAYNEKQGTLDDLMILVSYLKQQVRDTYGIQLQEAYQIQT
ncbi:MAG: hypothetical protein WC860_08630 [Candidatus Margulisiibacteriota bacterium]|jgi:UDP-N-acetylenolpyruvoylglucosamine reductase